MNDLSLSEFVFAPENTVFAICLGVLAALLCVEVVTLLMGLPLSAKIDSLFSVHADLHAPDIHADTPHAPDHGAHGGLDLGHDHGFFGTAWDWLNAGRVPLLVLIMVLLATFAGSGYLIQGVAHALVGWLPAPFAAAPALVICVPVTRRVSMGIAHVVPRDETYAVDAASLVGRTGVIVIGPLARGTIARVRVKDAFGNDHFPWVRTDDPAVSLATGDHVLLVELRGTEYQAIAADPKLVA